MLKFVKKDDLTKVVMTESDDGEIKITDYFVTPDPEAFSKKKKDEEECQTESESTE